MEAASTSSLLWSSALPSSQQPLVAPSLTLLFPTLSSAPLSSFKSLPICARAVSPLHTTATKEIVETAVSDTGFVEVGYVSSVHGLQGEICVKPSTDFPQLRFSKPGRRWLSQFVSGRKTIQEVELVEGRGHHGQKSWILRFEGVNTVDQARQLVGSTLLVREDDRPELDEGEFYSRDLVGMRVVSKESGECLGTVVNVFDSGASDLLQVMLHSSVAISDGATKLNTTEITGSGPLVWIPFVEAIVPNVNMSKREMWITPPKGLLELNIRSDERSKKERRQLEWKERKKNQRRLIAAKKKLCEMEQKHVFDGLRYGEKSQRNLLADEIVGINSKLLQQALQNIERPTKRWSVTELIDATRTNLIQSSLKIRKECLTPCASEDRLGANFHLQEKGSHLFSEGKTAIVLVVNDIEKESGDSPDLESKSSENQLFSFLQKSLSGDHALNKVQDCASVPLVLVCPVQETESLKELFSKNDYFGFDPNKVWFLEEEKLPVISGGVEEQNKHKILMESPWEILQSPVGSGGVLSLLASHGIVENLGEMGVEYIEVCSTSQGLAAVNSLLLGYVNAKKADVGIRILELTRDDEEGFDMIFSINLMKKLINQIDELPFYAIPKQNSHVKMVEKEWTEVVPSSPNSYELRCSIYSSLNACPLPNICVLEITE